MQIFLAWLLLVYNLWPFGYLCNDKRLDRHHIWLRKWILISSKFCLLLILLFPLLWRVILNVFLINNTGSSVDRITRLESTVALLNSNLLQLMSKFEQQNKHIQALENSHGMYKSLPSPWVKVIISWYVQIPSFSVG